MLQEIREANEHIRIMQDEAPLSCYLWNEHLNVVDCNPATITLFDVKDKQEFMDRYFELSPERLPDGRSSAKIIMEHTSATLRDGFRRFEWMHQTLDGSPLPTEVTLVRVNHGDKHLIACFTRDLRDIKAHEAKLERDRQRTDTLLELAQMTQQSEEDIIDYVIKSVVSLTDSTMGYVALLEHADNDLPFRALMLDQTFQCSLPMKTEEGTPHLLSPVLTECLITRKAVIHNEFFSLPGNRVFPEEHHDVRSHMNVPIMDGNKHIGILGVGNKGIPYDETDIEHLTLLAHGLGNLLNRKRFAENLEKAKNEAESANQAKSEFLTHMSHEIRTPLNGIIGLSDLFSKTSLDKKQQEYLQLIRKSGKDLLFLINDILDFSKIEAGKLEIHSEPFDISATVSSVLALFVSRAGAKNLELAISLSHNLPQLARGDAGRVRQILINLLGNAVKFTDSGGVRIDVTSEAMTETSLMIKFRVIDTGIGIAKSQLDRLFDAFTQVHASTAQIYGGTGLGLAIAAKLVHLMDGEIGVESEEGNGSTFWFAIPFECDPHVIRCFQNKICSENPTRDCPYNTGHCCTAFVNKEIADEQYSIKGNFALIVTSNNVQCVALKNQLQSWNMDCVTCASVEEALQLSREYWAADKPFDLFIIDSVFSGGTCAELTHELFEQERQQGGTDWGQAIILRPSTEDIDEETLDADRTEMISKPVFVSMLFDAVMNRHFAAKKRKDSHAGMLDSADLSSAISEELRNRKRSQKSSVLEQTEITTSPLAGQIHVLIVEDNRVNQIVVQNLLSKVGFTHELSVNGSEACEAIRNKKFDVVLMDCLMPVMDGFEAARLIRHWEREQGKKRIPIIALTANAVKEDVQRCFDAGMDAYCSKPINSKKVISLIEEWYKKRADL